MALKKLSERGDHENSENHEDEESVDHSLDVEGKKRQQFRRKGKTRRLPEKPPFISPKAIEEVLPEPLREHIVLKKSKSIREIFFNGPRFNIEPTPPPSEQQQEGSETIRDRFLKAKKTSKRTLEVGLVSSKSADSVPEFPAHMPLPALPLPPVSTQLFSLISSRNEIHQTQEEDDAETDDEETITENTVPDLSKLNLDDILNQHILGGSIQACQSCRVTIPKGISSILFQNRNYHFKCYVCYHCHCSLLEQIPHVEKDLLMCEDCHFALF